VVRASWKRSQCPRAECGAGRDHRSSLGPGHLGAASRPETWTFTPWSQRASRRERALHRTGKATRFWSCSAIDCAATRFRVELRALTLEDVDRDLLAGDRCRSRRSWSTRSRLPSTIPGRAWELIQPRWRSANRDVRKSAWDSRPHDMPANSACPVQVVGEVLLVGTSATFQRGFIAF